jgi:hypothetical protein
MDRSVPRWAGPLAWSLIALVLVCGATGAEAWPFNAFRLFSHSRSSVSIAWRIESVEANGQVRTVPASLLPTGFRGLQVQLGRIAVRTPEDRARLCDDLIDAVGSRRPDATSVRVVRVTRHLDRRVDGRSLASFSVAFECHGSDAHR